MSVSRLVVVAGATVVVCTFTVGVFAGGDPFADAVLSFDPGRPRDRLYDDPQAALGSPERFTGEGLFPSVVSPFSPPYGVDEIVSIAPGGQLTLAFNEPITDHPFNPYGIDLIIFGNTGFIDDGFPEGLIGGTFGADGGIVQVSADGTIWHTIPHVAADGLLPTLGFLDGGAYDFTPGSVNSDFTRPADPLLTLAFLQGRDFNELRAFYRGSGGGAGIDLATVGLPAISFVRIVNPRGSGESVEIDAVSDVSPRLPGDVNYDLRVNTDDLIALITTWGARQPGMPPTDFDDNGLVNTDDLLVIIGNWAP